MDQASQLFDRPDRRHAGTIALPTVVIRFAVAPRTTMTWRAPPRLTSSAGATKGST